MNLNRWIFASTLFLTAVVFTLSGRVSASPLLERSMDQTPQSGEIATQEQLEIAQAEWEQSAHADTFDNGLGANTTCARCKSPRNWDPSEALPAQNALDCGACKRVPGESRPILSGGVPVTEPNWKDIQCDVCHIPVGDSYYVEISYWNQALQAYEPVGSVSELCAHCHEGDHGFRVVEEQEVTSIHAEMECSECHGHHGLSSDCVDCHNQEGGAGSVEHLRHPSVNCSGCHDAGGLTIWQEGDPSSAHFGQFITRRFAHTLTSWPSHNITMDVDCKRCHHPLQMRSQSSAVVPDLPCDICHQEHPFGAVSFWCVYFPRDDFSSLSNPPTEAEE